MAAASALGSYGAVSSDEAPVTSQTQSPFGDGHAAERIAPVLLGKAVGG